jgi:hypothetical protein
MGTSLILGTRTEEFRTERSLTLWLTQKQFRRTRRRIQGENLPEWKCKRIINVNI